MNRFTHACLLLATILLVLSSTTLGTNLVFVVSPEGGDFRQIQDAVEIADSTDVIIVRPGTYRENIQIEHPVTLLGEEGVFLVPADVGQAVVSIVGVEGITIHGLTINMSTVGIEMLGSSGTISDCSIVASEIGISVVAYEGIAVAIRSVTLRGEKAGIGVQITGGSAMLSRCEFVGFGAGVSIGGEIAVILVDCTFTSNFNGLSIFDTATVSLVECIVQGNDGSGINLSQHPQGGSAGALTLVRSQIEENGSWGISLCGIRGNEPEQDFGQILGNSNSLEGNRQGIICPAAFLLPEGFLLE
jgi:hypothetical protein